jgi:hypothetical protein
VSSRTAARLAWGIASLCLTGTLAGLVLTALNDPLDWQFARFAAALTPLVAFPVVGALIATRQPRNPVGWLLLAVGALFMVDGTTGAYARYTLAVAPGSLPGGLVLAWVGALAFAPIVWVLLILLPLYFPTGRLLSSRWRLVAWAGGLFTALAIVGNGLRPDIAEIAGIGAVRNPFAIPSATHALDLLLNLALPLLVVGIGGAAAAMVVRFWRARGVERAQLKWFTYAASLTLLPFVAHDLAPPLAGPLFAVILPLVPVSIGIAILRYRLYDIDRLINRTPVYGLLSLWLSPANQSIPGNKGKRSNHTSAGHDSLHAMQPWPPPPPQVTVPSSRRGRGPFSATAASWARARRARGGPAGDSNSTQASPFSVPQHSLTQKVLLWYPSCGWSSVCRGDWT